jgi:predicted ester cyclase
MSEANAAVLHRWVDEVINQRQLEKVDELLSPDHVGHFAAHVAPEPIRGIAAYNAFVGAIHAGFPDLHATIEDLLTDGDKVVVRLRMRGTHLAKYRGIPPTGRSWHPSQILISRLVDARIVESWQEIDALGLMLQLGVVPPLGTGPFRLVGWVARTISRFAAIEMRAARRGRK